MSAATQKIQDKILKIALKDIPFDGLEWHVIEAAAQKAGYDADVAASVFPDKITDFLRYFAHWADDKMLESLESASQEELKIRERISLAVWTRLEVLNKHKEVVRLSAKYWVNPMHKPVGAKIIWRTADVIWHWAGDTATDYNKYTKRGLLSGVITATTLFWLNDKSDDHIKTRNFLDKRIENVLFFGRYAGKFVGKVKGLFSPNRGTV